MNKKINQNTSMIIFVTDSFWFVYKEDDGIRQEWEKSLLVQWETNRES